MTLLDDELEDYLDAGGLASSKAMRRSAAVAGGGGGVVVPSGGRTASISLIDPQGEDRERRKRKVRRSNLNQGLWSMAGLGKLFRMAGVSATTYLHLILHGPLLHRDGTSPTMTTSMLETSVTAYGLGPGEMCVGGGQQGALAGSGME